MGRLVTAPTHALLRTHRGRPDTGTRQQLRMDSRMNVQPTLHVELVPGGSPFNLEPGAEIEDTQGALNLLGLLAKFVSGTGDQ